MEMKSKISVILIIAVWNYGVCAREPECSKFEYEAKTLERMIKTEICVQKIKSDLDEREESMKEALEKIQEDWKTANNELDDVKERHEEALKNYKDEFDKIADVGSAVPLIAFQAHRLQNVSPSSGNTLIFKTTDFDKGSGYNNVTGVYTTPVNGVYLFTCQLCISLKKYIFIELVSSETSLVKMFFDGGNTHGACRKMTGISILKANDQIQIKIGRNSGSGDIFWENSESQNVFSGVLINTF